MKLLTQLAAEQASGIGALGINLQAFIFQLITFVIVLVILRKFVYGRLIDTLEARRKTVLDSLEDAKKTSAKLTEAEAEARRLLDTAKDQAADILETAKKESTVMVEQAEVKATKRAEHLIANAKQQLDQEVESARQQLKRETLDLVAQASETVLRQKVDAKTDAALIKQAVEEAKK